MRFGFEIRNVSIDRSFQGGRRATLDMDLIYYNSSEDDVIKIGQWKLGTGLTLTNISDYEPQTVSEAVEWLYEADNNEPVTLVVVTKEERPYVMLKEGFEGNDAYDGFAIDLLKVRNPHFTFKEPPTSVRVFFFQAISDYIGFRFRLYTVPDNLYGVENPETGEWNGIVRQLMDRRADLAVASMTINYARETVIDFTKPFMNLGIAVLFKVRWK